MEGFETDLINAEEISLEAEDERLKRINFAELSKRLQTEGLKEVPTLEALGRLVLRLEKKWPEYDSIISDDASGRLVSLLLKKIGDKKRVGLQPLKLKFVASGRHDDPRALSAIENFLVERKSELGTVLLVTEFIQTGQSIKKILDVLEKVGIQFDIAAVSTKENPHDYGNPLKWRLVSGETGRGGVGFYSKSYYSGVSKKTGTVGQKGFEAHPQKINYAEPEDKKAARRDLDVIAGELLKL